MAVGGYVTSLEGHLYTCYRTNFLGQMAGPSPSGDERSLHAYQLVQEPAYTLRVLLPPFYDGGASQSQRQSDIKALGGNQKPRREGPTGLTEHLRIDGKESVKPFPKLCIHRCIPYVQFCLETSQELQAALQWQKFPLQSFLDLKLKVEVFSLVFSF